MYSYETNGRGNTSATDAKLLERKSQFINLPAVTPEDNGKVLGVNKGKWQPVLPEGGAQTVCTLIYNQEDEHLYYNGEQYSHSQIFELCQDPSKFVVAKVGENIYYLQHASTVRIDFIWQEDIYNPAPKFYLLTSSADDKFILRTNYNATFRIEGDTNTDGTHNITLLSGDINKLYNDIMDGVPINVAIDISMTMYNYNQVRSRVTNVTTFSYGSTAMITFELPVADRFNASRWTIYIDRDFIKGEWVVTYNCGRDGTQAYED